MSDANAGTAEVEAGPDPGREGLREQPPPAAGDRIYFPELDGLRFVAFLMVYLFHGGVEPLLLARIVGSATARSMRANGGMGVQLFFILSGFLITTLLIREEKVYGRIDLRAFWVRRILRIWPLYYLVIFLGFFLFPALDDAVGTAGHLRLLRDHLAPFLAFAGNWSMIVLGPVPYDWLSVLWSVCVEEQFYILVPLLVALVPGPLRVPAVVALMAGSIAVRARVAEGASAQLTVVFNTFAQFDTLLSGVLLALLMGGRRDRPRLSRFLAWAQWPFYALVIWTMGRPHLAHDTPWNRTWDYVLVWACGVGVLMVAVWGGGWLGSALARPWVVWLGKISYGLYMYHEFALWAGHKANAWLPWFPHRESFVAIGTFLLTVAMAAVSYYAFELRFLRLKRRWTRVASRPV